MYYDLPRKVVALSSLVSEMIHRQEYVIMDLDTSNHDLKYLGANCMPQSLRPYSCSLSIKKWLNLQPHMNEILGSCPLKLLSGISPSCTSANTYYTK